QQCVDKGDAVIPPCLTPFTIWRPGPQDIRRLTFTRIGAPSRKKRAHKESCRRRRHIRRCCQRFPFYSSMRHVERTTSHPSFSLPSRKSLDVRHRCNIMPSPPFHVLISFL
ncbi:unnamed protein product, partial [Ectocarpus sp. 6 AP-2014]